MRLLYVWIFVVLLGAFYACDSKADDTALWLARSCVGEAGWDAWSTGECAAIMHVYKKRAESTGADLLCVTMRYSAAIKRRKERTRSWVMSLDREARKPKNWPSGADWERHRFNWLMTLLTAEFFMLGMVADTAPEALHYGGSMDPVPEGFALIKTGFRNRFYKRR